MDLAPSPRERAALSLLGLFVGDAFGEQFFLPEQEEEQLLPDVSASRLTRQVAAYALATTGPTCRPCPWR